MMGIEKDSVSDSTTARSFSIRSMIMVDVIMVSWLYESFGGNFFYGLLSDAFDFGHFA